MRAFPNVLRRQHVNADGLHEHACYARVLENGTVLVIVVNNKYPYIRKTTEEATE